jgi:hypothetical protein
MSLLRADPLADPNCLLKQRQDGCESLIVSRANEQEGFLRFAMLADFLDAG